MTHAEKNYRYRELLLRFDVHSRVFCHEGPDIGQLGDAAVEWAVAVTRLRFNADQHRPVAVGYRALVFLNRRGELE